MHAKCGGDRQYYESRGSRSVRPIRPYVVLAEPPWPFSLLDSTLRVSLPYSVVLSVLTVRTEHVRSFAIPIPITRSAGPTRSPSPRGKHTSPVERRGKPAVSCAVLWFGALLRPVTHSRRRGSHARPRARIPVQGPPSRATAFTACQRPRRRWPGGVPSS